MAPNTSPVSDRASSGGGCASSAGANARTEGDSTPAGLGVLLAQLLEPIVRLTGARSAAVRELIGDEFTYVASLGLPPRACGPRHSMDRHCGACGRAADTAAVVWSHGLAGCLPDVRDALISDGQDRMLVVPLQHRGRLLGVYNLFFDAQQAEPSPDTKAMLRAMGELLGMALNNALIEATEHSHQLRLERQRMAAEVHDSVAQSVTFMKMRLALLDDALAAGDTGQAQAYCSELRGAASDAHTSLRIVLTHFRESAEEALPVGKVLAARIEQWRRDADIDFTLDNRCPALELSPARANEVIHVVQEAVTNVIRHAHATHARVELRSLGAGRVEVLVDDDGAGLADDVTRANGTHYGLAIMRERAHRLHGSLDLGAREGGGTRVRLVFPERADHALENTIENARKTTEAA